MKKQISIITNYEKCPHNCWFCIWKGHKFKTTEGPSLKQIKNFLDKYKKLGYKNFSISGSDIIFERFYEYRYWWKHIFKTKYELGMNLNVHTNSRITGAYLLNNIDKLVISTIDLEDIKNYILEIAPVFSKKPIRIVHVVTKSTTKKKIEDYINFAKFSSIELTFKQLIIHDDSNKYMEFKQLYNNIYDKLVFLDKGDYNTYLMPDDKEYTKFLL